MSRLIICIALAASLVSGVVFAEEFVVTNGSSSGPGSLRNAVQLANGNGNPGLVDTITFDPGVTLVTQRDLEPILGGLGGRGPIAITQSVSIAGPGADELTIDGHFSWLDHSGRHNSGFPDHSTSTVTVKSGTLFEVGIFEQDNSAIHFTLLGVRVTGTNGLVLGREKAQVTLLDVSVRGNATTNAPGNLGSLISTTNGQLHMTQCRITENSVGQHKIITATGTTRISDCVVDSNTLEQPSNGLFLAGQAAEIVSCNIGIGKGQIQIAAQDNTIVNSILSTSVPGFTAVLYAPGNLDLRNVTILNSRILDNTIINQPSHLSHGFGNRPIRSLPI